MMRDDLATLIGSRICHDLISPIGAIGNGVELLEMTGSGAASPEMELISGSVQDASARIRFFRIAFGSAKGHSHVARREIRSILRAVGTGSRMAIDWQIEGDAPRDRVQVAFLVLQCFESAMPMGGEVSVTEAGPVWRMSATGKRLSPDAALWNGLADPDSLPQVTAARVQFALLPQVLATSGLALATDLTAERLTVEISPA